MEYLSVFVIEKDPRQFILKGWNPSCRNVGEL
jgi:hypothetical protein